MSALVKEIRHLDTAVVLVASGELTFEHSPAFHKTLVDLFREAPPHLVVDLSNLTYIDSSGVGTLVDIFRKSRARQSRFSLVGLRATVRSVFEITKLDGVFSIYPTIEEACSS